MHRLGTHTSPIGTLKPKNRPLEHIIKGYNSPCCVCQRWTMKCQNSNSWISSDRGRSSNSNEYLSRFATSQTRPKTKFFLQSVRGHAALETPAHRSLPQRGRFKGQSGGRYKREMVWDSFAILRRRLGRSCLRSSGPSYQEFPLRLNHAVSHSLPIYLFLSLTLSLPIFLLRSLSLSLGLCLSVSCSHTHPPIEPVLCSASALNEHQFKASL